MKTPRAVLFDLDDTLFDHRHSMRTALGEVQKKYKCFAISTLDEFEKQHVMLLNDVHFNQILTGEVTPEEGRAFRFKRIFSLYGINASDELSNETAEFYRENYKNAERLKPGAAELLTKIKEKYKIGIVTNNIVEEQNRKLVKGGINHLVDVMVTSEEVGVTKPDALIFQTALERLSCSPEETIMLGDQWEMDIVGAYKVGIKCIWVNTYDDKRENNGIAVEIKSLENTEMVLNLINNNND